MFLARLMIELKLKKLNEIETFRVRKKDSHVYWMVKVDDTKSCIMDNNRCGQIIQNNPTEKTIKWDTGNITKLKHFKNLEWTEIE